jgi:hypothetical protein
MARTRRIISIQMTLSALMPSCRCSRVQTRATLYLLRHLTVSTFRGLTLMLVRVQLRSLPQPSISYRNRKHRISTTRGHFDGMTLSVRFFSRCCSIFLPHNLASLRQFRGFGSPIPPSDLECDFPNQKITTFLLSHYFDRSSVHWLFPVIHRPCFESCYRTCSSGGLPPSVEFIALLAITCATALQFLPETDEDVRFLSYLHVSAYIHVTVGYSLRRLRTGEGSPAAALNRIRAFCAIILHRFNLSSFVT